MVKPALLTSTKKTPSKGPEESPVDSLNTTASPDVIIQFKI